MRLRLLSGTATIAALALAPWIAGGQTLQGVGGQQSQQQAPAVPGGSALSARPAQGAAAGDGQGAQQCLRQLTAFGEQMEHDGYWLSGYRRGYGWSTYGMAAPARRIGMATPPPAGAAAGEGAGAPSGASVAQSGGTNANAGAATAGARPAAPIGPWGNMNWNMAPGQELGTLYSAAAVLAHRGDEQTCQAVLHDLKATYADYTQQLRQAGVQPNQVVSYRQQQLAMAQPVTQMNRVFRADAITGTDVRNPQDQDLGSVEDVIVNPQTGQISYVILARGGFLGLGDEHVAVPWQRLKVTPNMDLFVLDTTPQALDQAPQVNPDTFASTQNFNQRRQEIDKYWQQQAGKSG